MAKKFKGKNAQVKLARRDKRIRRALDEAQNFELPAFEPRKIKG